MSTKRIIDWIPQNLWMDAYRELRLALPKDELTQEDKKLQEEQEKEKRAKGEISDHMKAYLKDKKEAEERSNKTLEAINAKY